MKYAQASIPDFNQNWETEFRFKDDLRHERELGKVPAGGEAEPAQDGGDHQSLLQQGEFLPDAVAGASRERGVGVGRARLNCAILVFSFLNFHSNQRNLPGQRETCPG